MDLDRHGRHKPPGDCLSCGGSQPRSAKRLWAKIPEAYRQHATFYTDQYVVYEG